MGITVATFWRTHTTLTLSDLAMLNVAIRQLPPEKHYELQQAFRAHDRAILKGLDVDDAFNLYMVRLSPLFESALGVKDKDMVDNSDILAWFANIKAYLKNGNILHPDTIRRHHAEWTHAQMVAREHNGHHGGQSAPGPVNVQMGPPRPSVHHSGHSVPAPVNVYMGPLGPMAFHGGYTIPGPGNAQMRPPVPSWPTAYLGDGSNPGPRPF